METPIEVLEMVWEVVHNKYMKGKLNLKVILDFSLTYS